MLMFRAYDEDDDADLELHVARHGFVGGLRAMWCNGVQCTQRSAVW